MRQQETFSEITNRRRETEGGDIQIFSALVPEDMFIREVRDFLRLHPLIASYQLAAEREGGAGVTIAKLITV